MNQVESEAKSQQKETDGSLIIWQSNGRGSLWFETDSV